MQMAIYTMGIGRMTKPMDSDNTLILMVHSMKAIGLMINNMVKVKNNGLMVLNTKVNTNLERKTDLVSSAGLINQVIVEILLTTIFMEMEHIHGLTVEFSTAHGLTIKCMETEYSPGLMVVSMKVIIMMIKKKAMVCFIGLMVESTMDTGRVVNKRVLAFTTMPKVK